MKRLVSLALALGCGPSEAADGFVSPRADAVTKTDAEWRSSLTAEQYRILRKKGTERAFTGKYWDNKAPGIYSCGGCGLALFSSDDKFRSGTGWPSFTRPIEKNALADAEDNSLWMSRTEILCNRCGGHLGHVFPDGPPPTGQRFCINGNALDFQPKEAKP
ncbi:MAG: peptide-methionine (R)-S-oxide reductase MsrB [Myxococcota bacterium]|nr:peptide-methionine (R)-S-oxide reductase MsrB [Myxococcota bacterium]MEC9389848.1 peptide-methionine (R)-S-oxide reductase MsrB [Myxococcota bacterium]